MHIHSRSRRCSAIRVVAMQCSAAHAEPMMRSAVSRLSRLPLQLKRVIPRSSACPELQHSFIYIVWVIVITVAGGYTVGGYHSCRRLERPTWLTCLHDASFPLIASICPLPHMVSFLSVCLLVPLPPTWITPH